MKFEYQQAYAPALDPEAVKKALDQIKPGDVVRLKSGGPLMTVDRLLCVMDQQSALCAWFDEDNNLRSVNLRVTALTKEGTTQ